MDSGQLPEPDPPEPPDPPSSPVQASNSYFSTVKALTLCQSYLLDRPVLSKGLSIYSSHLLLLSSASESFLSPDLNLRFSQISLYYGSGILLFFIFSLAPVPRSFSTSVLVAGLLVLSLGSSNGLITAECSLSLWVSSPPVAITVRFIPRLVSLVVASCTGDSTLITTSCFLHLLTIQVVFLRFSNLFTGVVLIVLKCSRGLSSGPSLALVRAFTALDGVMSDISIPWVLLVDTYCQFSSSVECVFLPISLSTLSGFVSESKTFKIRDTSVIEVLIKSSAKWCSVAYVCIAISKIVNSWLLRLGDLSMPLVVYVFCMLLSLFASL
ncbi:hypothetical protein Bca52824_025294 [Brassica carinata]|uniref:Uncharacterized protein n=1 Tax=Brassica carinata TaxID=52824 RepID=A0A8X8AXN9_BRACI|nr:hypothetical protein Bca52824_025294 [Brassica carinata]